MPFEITKEIHVINNVFIPVPKAHYPRGFYNVKPMTHKIPKTLRPVKALNNGLGGRIVGGTKAERGEFPHQISWRMFGSHS